MNKTFSSSRGSVLNLKPVSQFKLDSLRTANRVVPIPTYQTSVVGGASETIPLDEKIAKNKGRVEEWEAYLEEKKQADQFNAKKFWELMVWEGVEVEVPGEESQWYQTCKHFGMDVPENPVERKLFYVYNELLGTPEDIANLISEIFAVSQIDAKVVAKLRESFRAGISGSTDRPGGKKPGKVENKQPDV